MASKLERFTQNVTPKGLLFFTTCEERKLHFWWIQELVQDDF